MKKLSILITLMLCLTISGVYAAWSYAGTDDIADAYAEAKATITDAELTGANGTYTITSNLVLTVDQANDDHEAKLDFSSNDSNPIHLTVTFTPSKNAPETIKDSAVASTLSFTTTTAMQYKIDAEGNYSDSGTPTDIFKFTYPLTDPLDIVWVGPAADGSFTYSLDADDLQDYIQLSETFVLDIKSEHDAFRSAMDGNIRVIVSDGITT